MILSECLFKNSEMNLRVDSFFSWLSSVWLLVRAGLSIPLVSGMTQGDGVTPTDSEFDGWLRGDPKVTKNPASRYGDRTPGYITGNGLGSMEIGAADD